MCSKNTLKLLLEETSVEMRKIFGTALCRVILYGSYAREDFNEESDIDVMVLVDMDKSTLSTYRRQVSEFSDELDLKYNVLLSIKLQDKATFEKYSSVLPYYRNVLNEGVIIGA